MVEINIDITPEEYKKLWWKAVCNCLPSAFTANDLRELLAEHGIHYGRTNAIREALRNAQIEVIPDVTLRTKNGRPPLLYRVVKST